MASGEGRAQGRRGLLAWAGCLVAAALGAGCQDYELLSIEPRAVGVRDVRIQVTGKPLASNVMLVVDKSGSMTESVTGTGMNCTFDGTSGSEYDPRSTNPCKWNDLKAAFTDPTDGFLTGSGGLARFGLLAFPGEGGSCAEGSIVVPVGDDVEPIRRALMSDLVPSGGTPTTAALLEAAGDPLLAGSEPNRQRFVMLLTDGLPNCNDANAALCSQCRADAAQCSAGCRPTEEPGTCDVVPFDGAACLDEENLVAAVRQLRSQGIVTFVIGFGRDTASSDASGVLNRAAVEGGHPRLGAAESYYQANSVEELKGFLEELLVEFPCTYELDPPPSERDLLSVNLRDGKAGRPDLADRILVEGTEWEFASGALDAVRLIGPVCDLVQNAEFGRYEVQIIYAEPL
jgi:hypothetical protein